jgi:hypothetical protein
MPENIGICKSVSGHRDYMWVIVPNRHKAIFAHVTQFQPALHQFDLATVGRQIAYSHIARDPAGRESLSACRLVEEVAHDGEVNP